MFIKCADIFYEAYVNVTNKCVLVIVLIVFEPGRSTCMRLGLRRTLVLYCYILSFYRSEKFTNKTCGFEQNNTKFFDSNLMNCIVVIDSFYKHHSASIYASVKPHRITVV